MLHGLRQRCLSSVASLAHGLMIQDQWALVKCAEGGFVYWLSHGPWWPNLLWLQLGDTCCLARLAVCVHNGLLLGQESLKGKGCGIGFGILKTNKWGGWGWFLILKTNSVCVVMVGVGDGAWWWGACMTVSPWICYLEKKGQGVTFTWYCIRNWT